MEIVQHFKIIDNSYYCCGVNVDTKKKLFNHLNSVHFSGDVLKNENDPWICSCNESITRKVSIMRHFSKSHKGVHKYYLKNYHLKISTNLNTSSFENNNVTNLDFDYEFPQLDNDSMDIDTNQPINDNNHHHHQYINNNNYFSEHNYSFITDINFNDLLDKDSTSINYQSEYKKKCIDKLLYLKKFVNTSLKDFIFLVFMICSFLINQSDFLIMCNQFMNLTKSVYTFTTEVLKYSSGDLKFEEINFTVKNTKSKNKKTRSKNKKSRKNHKNKNSSQINSDIISDNNSVNQSETEIIKMYYFPLENIIKNYFRNEVYAREIFNDYFSKEKDPLNKEIEIRLELYYDDFSTIDGLSYASKRNSISAVYLTLDNISYDLQCKRKDINVLQLAYRQDVDIITFKKFFEKFISDFNKLNNNKIKLKNEYTLKLKLDKVICDNKAINELKNITTCFRSNACAWCNISYSDLQNKKDFDFLPRPDFKDHIFSEISSDSFLFCPDIFHDLAEGILRDFTKYFLHKYYKQNFHIFFANQKKFKLKYGSIPFTPTSYKSTGMQQLELFFLLPFYDSENRIDRNSNDFQFYIFLRIIMAYIYADKVDRTKLDQFDQLVKSFFTFFKENILELKKNKKSKKKQDKLHTITFKLHHLIHYSDFMRNKGAMYKYSTLRFERVHQLLKKFYSSSHCRVNIPLQLAKKYLEFKNNSILQEDSDNNSDFQLIYVNYLKETYHQFFIHFDNLFKTKKIKIKNLVLSIDSYFLVQNDPIKLIKIKKIYQQDNKTTLICKVYEQENFENNLVSYKLKKNNNLVSYNPLQIISHKNVTLQKINNIYYLPLSFYLIEN